MTKSLLLVAAVMLMVLLASPLFAGRAYVVPVQPGLVTYGYYPVAPVYYTYRRPAVVATPVYAPAPMVAPAVVPAPVYVFPKVYVAGQPVRNVIRAVTP